MKPACRNTVSDGSGWRGDSHYSLALLQIQMELHVLSVSVYQCSGGKQHLFSTLKLDTFVYWTFVSVPFSNSAPQMVETINSALFSLVGKRWCKSAYQETVEPGNQAVAKELRVPEHVCRSHEAWQAWWDYRLQFLEIIVVLLCNPVVRRTELSAGLSYQSGRVDLIVRAYQSKMVVMRVKHHPFIRRWWRRWLFLYCDHTVVSETSHADRGSPFPPLHISPALNYSIHSDWDERYSNLRPNSVQQRRVVIRI